MDNTLSDIANLVIVISACGLSLIVPPLRTAVWLSEEKTWPHIVLSALVLGLSSQGILGFVWNHFLLAGIYLEITLYLLFWLIVTLVVSLRRDRQTISHAVPMSKEGYLLIALVVLAVAVRSIHPLQHMALGQSDAYSHLQFLRNILESGYVHNMMYPPGFHWILALPTAAFHLDPYVVARYGGAFFGAGLVLAVYVLMKSIAGNPAAMLTAFLVSCFPGLNLLLKTGVGVFANQLGLFFIPVVLFFFKETEEKTPHESPGAFALFVISLMGLSVSVPMMLVHVLIILFMVRAAKFINWRYKWYFHTFVLIFSVLPALILLGLHLHRAGPVHQLRTMDVITAGSSIKSTPSAQQETLAGDGQSTQSTGYLKAASNHPVMTLLYDFLSAKRMGIGHPAASMVGFLIFITSGIGILWGLRNRQMGGVVLGFWGSIASLQTLTGFLQFSGYQREGWSLMIAAACLSGVVGGIIYLRGRRRVIFRAAVAVAVLSSITVSFIYPPVHELRASCAEDEIIRLARQASYRYAGNRYWSIADKPIERDAEYLSAFSSHLPLTVMTRRLTGWHDSNQGELVPSVIRVSDGIRVKTVSSEGAGRDIFNKDHQYLVLLDKKTESCSQGRVLFARIDPGQVKRSMDVIEAYYEINQFIEARIETLSPAAWHIQRRVISPNLIAVAVTPKQTIH